ncbi:YD repeat-containing protein, partial [Pseudomonas amygdali pv. mori str. 301020]
GVEQIPELLTSRGSKSVTALKTIRQKDAARLLETTKSYRSRIDSAISDYKLKTAEFFTDKEVNAVEALGYMQKNIGKTGMTAHARSVIKKDLSLARKELKKIPTVENIRHSNPAPRKVGLDRYLRGKPKDKYTFDSD